MPQLPTLCRSIVHRLSTSHASTVVSAFPSATYVSRRGFLVRFSQTPNEACYKFFVDGVTFLPSGGTLSFDLENSYQSPLADHLLRSLPMLEEVAIGPHFVTVRRVEPDDAAAAAARHFQKKTSPAAHREDDENDTESANDRADEATVRDMIAAAHWGELKLHVCALLTDHLYTGRPHVEPDAPHPHPDTLPCDTDTDVVRILKELIATEIRPRLQEDGGDIRFVRLNGAVMEVEMLGACRHCKSGGRTLRDLIERTTRHWVPEVQSVREVGQKEMYNPQREAGTPPINQSISE